MSLKPILNDPNALNNKSLDLFCDELTANVINSNVVSEIPVQVVDPSIPLTIFQPNKNTENEYIITQLDGTYDPTASATTQGIILTDEQVASGKSYSYTITGMSCNVLLDENPAVQAPVRPFNFGGAPYGISPTQGQTLSVRLLWRPELQAWVRVGL